jgi:transcriptional regulator with XRE-family HTH domain
MKNIRKGGAKLYEKFAELLAKTNKTAYQVSKDTGIAQSLLSDWKLGKIKILGANKLKILADYFGVSIEYFLEQCSREGVR